MSAIELAQFLKFKVGAEAADAITVTAELSEKKGVRHGLIAYLSDAASGAGISGTAASGGIADGGAGDRLHTFISGKMVLVNTDANGQFALTITHVGAKTWYVVVISPDGSLEVSPAVTFA